MNLTLLKRRPRLSVSPLLGDPGKHEEIEELENYLNDTILLRASSYQKQQMQSAELLRIRLDTARNTLLLVNTQFGSVRHCIRFVRRRWLRNESHDRATQCQG